MSEFRRLVDDEFGQARGRMLASHQSLTAFGGRTPEDVMASGVDPKRVWEALAEQMDVPADRRLGRDLPLLENRDKY